MVPSKKNLKTANLTGSSSEHLNFWMDSNGINLMLFQQQKESDEPVRQKSGQQLTGERKSFVSPVWLSSSLIQQLNLPCFIIERTCYVTTDNNLMPPAAIIHLRPRIVAGGWNNNWEVMSNMRSAHNHCPGCSFPACRLSIVVQVNPPRNSCLPATPSNPRNPLPHAMRSYWKLPLCI